MQPTPFTALQVRLDLPDPGRCTECQLPKREGQKKQRKQRRRRRG